MRSLRSRPMLTMASPLEIMSQNLSLQSNACMSICFHCSGVWSHSQGRLLPSVRPFVVVSHRGPVRALQVQLSLSTVRIAAMHCSDGRRSKPVSALVRSDMMLLPAGTTQSMKPSGFNFIRRRTAHGDANPCESRSSGRSLATTLTLYFGFSEST